MVHLETAVRDIIVMQYILVHECYQVCAYQTMKVIMENLSLSKDQIKYQDEILGI